MLFSGHRVVRVIMCWQELNARQWLLQVGSFGGLADEVEGLKRDKNVLMLELVRVRQQQQVHRPRQEAKQKSLVIYRMPRDGGHC